MSLSSSKDFIFTHIKGQAKYNGAVKAVSYEELCRLADLFDILKEERLSTSKTIEAVSIDHAFQTHVRNVLERLESRLRALADERLQFLEAIMARHGLYDVIFQQAIILSRTAHTSSVLASTLKELRGTHARFMTDIQLTAEHSLLVAAAASSENGGSVSKVDLPSPMSPSRPYEDSKGHSGRHSYYQATSPTTTPSGRRSIDSLSDPEQRITLIAAAATAPMSPLQLQQQHQQQISPSHVDGFWGTGKGNTNEDNLDSHSVHSAPATMALSSHAPSGWGPIGQVTSAPRPRPQSARPASALTSSIGDTASTKHNSYNRHRFHASFVGTNLHSDSDPNKNHAVRYPRSDYITKPSQPHSQPSNSSAQTRWLLGMRSETSVALNSGQCRAPSIRECKENIELVLASAHASEQQQIVDHRSMSMMPTILTTCETNNSDNIGNGIVKKADGVTHAISLLHTSPSTLTLEMHMFKFLEGRYGLRAIAARQAASLLIGIATYASEENFIACFYRALINEVGAGFWRVQLKLVSTVEEFVINELTRKYSNMSAAALNARLDEESAAGFLTERQWLRLVNSMFGIVDSTALSVILKRQAFVEESLENTSPKSIEDGAILSALQQQHHISRTGNVKSSGGIVAPKFYTRPFSADSRHRNSPIVKNPSPSAYRSSSVGSSEFGTLATSFSSNATVNSTAFPANSLTTSLKSSSNGGVKLRIRTFIRLLLDFNLDRKVTYLKPFRVIFRRFDSDGDGVLSRKEFSSLLIALWDSMKTGGDLAQYRRRSSVIEPERGGRDNIDDSGGVLSTHITESIVQLLDPRGTGLITFSMAATHLKDIIARLPAP